MSSKIAFIDIETDSLDINTANIVLIGVLDEFGTYIYDSTQLDIAKEKLQKYDKLITFNGDFFDFPILKRYGFNINFWNQLDLRKIFKKRATLITPQGFKSYSLNNLSKDLGFGEKLEVDHKIFQRKDLTIEEKVFRKEYLEQDLQLTRKLWNFLLERFDSMKEFISEKDAYNYKHITCSSGVFAYKAFCNLTGLLEEYSEDRKGEPYVGAFVLKAHKERNTSPVMYFDFASLYPMLYTQANLFSNDCNCCQESDKWSGNEILKTKGKYCKKKLGNIEENIRKLYLLRKDYKSKKDKREQAIKIILNSLYGISANPTFANMYAPNRASDCTALGQQCIKYAIEEFKKQSYNVLYADTDSIFVELTNHQRDEALQLANTISTTLSAMFPFPWKEFNLKLEDDIQYINFFKKDDDTLKKKNYIYLNNSNKLTIKGLDIIQKDCSKLSKLIFENHIKPYIINNKDCKFASKKMDNIIKEYLATDLTLIGKTFNLKDTDAYKSDTSIYAQFSKKYGSGEIILIKTKDVGIGKNKKYCSIEEAKQLSINKLDLSDVYSELKPFIKEEQTKLLWT